MNDYNPCVGCEYFNKPYWSVVSPCKNCPQNQYTGGYVATTTTEWTSFTVPTNTVDVDKALEWLEGYVIKDSLQVYTNGSLLVPLFRVRQALKDKAYEGFKEG